MQHRRRRGTAALAAAAATATILSLGATVAHADAPDDGLVAEYIFDQDAGTSVANSAAGSSFGPAVVRNGQDADWTGDALRLRGGSKTSTGDWVELPDDLLEGATAATVTAEVKPSAASLNGFHFLWSIGNDSSATEYFFASLNCASGRAPLVGLKTDGSERLVQASSCGLQPDEWISVTSVVDGGTASLFIDGEQVAQGPVGANPGGVLDQSLNTIGRSPWPDALFQGEVGAFRVYDRALTPAEIAEVSDTDAEPRADLFQQQAQDVIDSLALTDQSTSTDIDLPTAGGNVTWTSSDPDVVGADGAVTAPLQGADPIEVELTASTEVRGFTASQTITVTVVPSDETAAERVQRLAERFVIPPVVRSGDALPAAPAGTSVAVVSASNGVSVDDAIVLDGSVEADAEITVRVTDAVTGATVDRVFEVAVLPEDDSAELLAYDRVPTSTSQANNADVALSMHLALDEGSGWAPLNENYGIFFPKTSVAPPAAGTTDSIIRSLRDPHLFQLADGDFGIVATRTARGGGSDGTQSSQLLLARSSDLRSYDEIGLIDLGVSSGVNEPAAVYDSAASTYVVSWESDAGAAMYTTFDDITDEDTRGEVQRGQITATAGIDDASVENFASGNEIAVRSEIAAALEVRFGRIANTSVSALEAVTVSQGDELTAADLPQRASLGYDDGSDAVRAIAWDEDALAAVDTSAAGTYEVTGTVKQAEYATPFADERADPSVFRYDWNGQTKFLMIATDDYNGNNIGSPHMPIRIADSIEQLSDDAIAAGENVEIDLLSRGDLDANGNAMTGCFWAPEFHLIDGRLSVLFMPCYDNGGRPDMWTGRASIIQLQNDEDGSALDPADPDNWTKAQQVVRPDGSALNQIQGISLDMTFFEDGGTSYYVWQMLGALFIAEVDPASPTRLLTDPVRIGVPEYAWDNTIAEGPNVLEHDGTLYMIYSGSTVGDSYTTGLITAPVGGDLLSPETWTKLNYPIQKSGIFNGSWQLGTGHGMWSYDEDGNVIYVFHARTSHNGLNGRDMFVRRVHWAADGLPVFDMEQDEEVAPANRQVSVQVTVQASASIELSATTRCVAGRVVLVSTATNPGAAPVTVDVASHYGSKSVTLAAGRSASQAFSTRLASIPAGSVSADGVTAAYAAASCG